MTARKSPLRAVSPNEVKPKGAPKSVAEAVDSGTHREQLVAMRVRIAKAIDDPNIRGADLAALSRRLLEIGREVDSLDAAVKQEADENGSVPDAPFNAASL